VNSITEKLNSRERTCVAGILCVTTSEGSLHEQKTKTPTAIIRHCILDCSKFITLDIRTTFSSKKTTLTPKAKGVGWFAFNSTFNKALTVILIPRTMFLALS